MRLPTPQFHTAAAAFGATMLLIATPPGGVSAQTPAETPAIAPSAEAADMDALFAELAQTQGEVWVRAESDIQRIWSRSGSAAADMLLLRGEAALDAGDPRAAIGHLTALVENAPDFAAGWAARGAAFYFAGQVGPAAADLAQALRLEPRHWPALTLLATLLEESGDRARALEAYLQSQSINPHQQEVLDGIDRLTAGPAGQDA